MKNLYKWVLMSAIALSAPLLGLAQNRTITGTVSDVQGPIVGATVVVKETPQMGTTTDGNGNFTISVPGNASALVVGFLGYTSQEVAVSGRSRVDVVLVEDAIQIGEATVSIGYSRVRRIDVTGAVASVSGADLVSAPVTTTAQALQGKAAGVNIVTASGAPGAGTNITIRGAVSITNSTTPLYIVDGFEMGSALDNINPNDIESIDILKDASSTAIYGARGANGIVLITTKSGRAGKTQVTYNTFFSFDRLSNKMDILDNAQDFAEYQYEFAELKGSTTQWAQFYDNNLTPDAAGFYTGVYDRIASQYGDGYAIDWQDEAFGKTAMTQSHNLTLTTGNERTQALVSYNNTSQNGLLDHTGQWRNSIRAKLNTELYKGVRLDVSTLFNNTRTDGGGNYSGMKKVLMQPITGGTHYSREELLGTQTYQDYSGADTNYDTENPLVENDASRSSKVSRTFLVNGGIEIDILKNLVFRSAGQYSWSQDQGDSFSDEDSRAALTNTNEGIVGKLNFGESYRWQITNTLNWNKDFGKHRLNALLGQETNLSHTTYDYAFSLKNFPYPNFGLEQIDEALIKEMEGGKSSENRLMSFFGRVGWNYDERYLINVSLRRDGSSKFLDPWKNFPSVAGAWRISEEAFYKGSRIANVISSFKLRAGYGMTGNNSVPVGAFATQFNLSSYPMNNNAGFPAYVVGTRLGNPDLEWETVESTSVGADIAFAGSRVNLSVDWYNNAIDNMLMSVPVPSSTGYASQYQNIGRMRNRGWEFTLNTLNVSTENFRWESNFNISFNKAKVIRLADESGRRQFDSSSDRGAQLKYFAEEGKELGIMYGAIHEGVYTTDDFNIDGTLKEGVVKPMNGITAKPGLMKFRADNEAGDQFTNKGVAIGNGTPDAIGGLSNNLYWKGFDLNVFMKFSIGNDIYNATRNVMMPFALSQNVTREMGTNFYRLIDPATGRITDDPARLKQLNPDEKSRLWSLSPANSGMINTTASSYYVEDGSYLRIAQVTLGYTLPKAWVNKAKIANARLYFTVNNLATITGYSGYDPEVSAADSDNVVVTPGFDKSMYPRSRSYVVGLNLTF